MPPALLVLLLASAAVAQAGHLTGNVVDAAGDPVEGAYVQARAGEPPDIVAQAQTNGNGLYAFEAPAGLFTLSVTARGYYVIAAGGLDSDTITHSCPAEGECGEVNFRLGKPGVVEGWLSDRFGDPVWGVPLLLRPAGVAADSSPRSTRMATHGAGASDDRGYFRIWNMRPGRYILESDSRMRRNQPFHVQPQEIEIAEQGKTIELRLPVDSNDALHTISGIVEGVTTEVGGYAAVAIQPRSGRRWDFASGRVLPGGKFSVSGLKTGDYVLRLIQVNRRQERQEFRMLAELHVDRDMKDLRLTPQPGAGIHLAVKFKEMAKRNVDLELSPADELGLVEHLPLRAPDYEVTRSGLIAGEYQVRLSDDDCYLAEPYRVTLQHGQTATLTVEVGNAFAAPHGRVRVAEGAQRAGASHFTVGARGPHRSYKTQADDGGRFSFAKLPPGSYKVAAWPKPDIDPEDNALWGDARGIVSVEVEPGFDVEIDVTASP